MLLLAIKHAIYDVCINHLFSNIISKFASCVTMSPAEIQTRIDTCIITGFMPTRIITKNTCFSNIHELKMIGELQILQVICEDASDSIPAYIELHLKFVAMRDIISVEY